jgi:two-component system OmpR family response regulator
MRIYVINDNAALVALCEMALESRGHEVETTIDATAVGAAVARFQPDAIVLDWMLHDRTGGQVLQELQATFHSPPPVLVMSSLDLVEPEAMRRGARAFLRKPFTDEALVAAVEALVDGGEPG